MDWFLRSLGISGEVLEHWDDAHLAFQRPLLLLVGFLLLVPLGYFIYRRQRANLQTVPARVRIGLSATRIVILAILLAILAGPYLKIDKQLVRKPIFAVLVDNSQSMRLPAGPYDSEEQVRAAAEVTNRSLPDGTLGEAVRQPLAELPRHELALAAVRHAKPQLHDALAGSYDLRYYSFARQTIPWPQPHDAQAQLSPDDDLGTASHLGSAVDQVLEEAAGQRVSGILVLSDGQNTGGQSPLQAARAAAEERAPIFGVPLGPERRVQDVSVVDVYSSGLVSVGDHVSVHATIESQGFAGRTIQVQLKDQDEVLATREISLQDAEQQQVELSFKAEHPGAKLLQVQVAEQPEEAAALRSNNLDAAFVRISDHKLKVLLIDGLPRWDFRFLKNAIRRDHGLAGRATELPEVVLETEWRRATSALRDSALPQSLEELAEYHTIVVGDASAELLTPAFCELLARAVRERGVGLLVAAGPHAMPHAAPEVLQELLPVRIQAGRAGQEAPVYNPYRLQISAEGSIHETLRLYDDPGRNQEVWERMPPFFWCAAVDRAAPGATVLSFNNSLTNAFGKVPLIAYQFAGDGQVMFVGTDSTWLWRQNVGDRYFYRFWGQAIRFVARREKEAEPKNYAEIRPHRAQPGEQAKVELRAYRSDGSPETAPELTVTALGPEGRESFTVKPDPNQAGRYVGTFTPTQPGVHRVIYEPGNGGSVAEASVQVLLAPAEFRHPSANRDLLQSLASATGGQVLALNELHKIPSLLRGEVEHRKLHREATIWDNWLTLTVLILVYSCDVGIRRLMGLS